MSETKCSTFNRFLLCKYDKLSERLIFHCIHSSSLTLSQNPSKTYHYVSWNVVYKTIVTIRSLFLHDNCHVHPVTVLLHFLPPYPVPLPIQNLSSFREYNTLRSRRFVKVKFSTFCTVNLDSFSFLKKRNLCGVTLRTQRFKFRDVHRPI